MGRNRRFTAAVHGHRGRHVGPVRLHRPPDPGASRTAPRSPAGATAPPHPTATATRPPAKRPGAPEDFTGDGRHARTIPEAATAVRIIDLNGDGYGGPVIGHASPTPGDRGVTVLRGSGHGVPTGSPQEITEDSLGRSATPSAAAFGYGFAR